MTAPPEVDRMRCLACDDTFDEAGGPVYECSRCGGQQVEERRCQECNIFMAKLADESCPECEEPALEGFDPVTMYEAADGTYHDTPEEALQWVVDAPVREEARIAAKARLDAKMAEYAAEKDREWTDRAAPLLTRLRNALDPSISPELIDTIDYALRSRSDGIHLYIDLPQLARYTIPGPETEAELAVVDDLYPVDGTYAEVRERTHQLALRIATRLETIEGGPGIVARIGHYPGLGTRWGFNVYDLAPTLLTILE